MQIIIVDDEPVSVTMLKRLVEKLPDCNGRGFTHASAALDWCKQNDPDLVIVDYMMPLMNGADFARELRADTQFADTKIILNSGLPEAAIREHFGGYDAFLRKPFKVEALLELVQRFIGR